MDLDDRKKIDEWRKSGDHKPPFLRDFHDAKLFFKTLETWGPKRDLPGTWMDHMVFTIDCFLWVCAKFGWTLQRSKKQLNFDDVERWTAEYDAVLLAQMNIIINDKET